MCSAPTTPPCREANDIDTSPSSVEESTNRPLAGLTLLGWLVRPDAHRHG
ncbi:hypothetical protein [Cellulomonas flavigena]|nr:hypothetical protein [Cellulomonas flavigena]